MPSSSSSHRYSPYSSSSSSYAASSPASSDSTRYSSPRSDYGSPASTAANSPSFDHASPKIPSSLSGSCSIPSLPYRPSRDGNSQTLSQYYIDEYDEVHKATSQVDGRTNMRSFQLIKGDGPKPYVVIPHDAPHELVRTACIQFSRAIQVQGSWMRLPGLCLKNPQRDLHNRKSKPFPHRRNPESDRINLHLQWPGQQLGSTSQKADSARRVVLLRGGELSLEDLAFAVSEFVTDQLTRAERMGQPPGFEQWQLQSRRCPQGIKMYDLAVWGLCELFPGHWQVILHWYPYGKDLS